jgi:DNA-binding NarL/FixJ family response regulator
MMIPTDLEVLDAHDHGRPIRVLVADDHPLTRLGIRYALGEGFDVRAEVGDAESAVAAARRERPEICLLDVDMPGNGIWAAAQIVAELPEVAVVMISAARDDETLLDALRAGAVGYLSKEMAFTRLPEALRGVLNGEAAVPRDVTARLLGELRRPRRLHPHGRTGRAAAALTSRETDVLELLLEGLATAEIARKLFLSPPTVRSHVAAVMRKFGVRDRAALRALFEPGQRPAEDGGA